MKLAICQGCNTEKPIRCRGLCTSCYDKWIYRSNPDLRAKKLANAKAYAMRSEKPEQWRSTKRGHKKRLKARRRWWANHPEVSQWPVGAKVSYQYVAGFPPIVGVILRKNKTSAMVQFETFRKRICFRWLTRVEVPA